MESSNHGEHGDTAKAREGFFIDFRRVAVPAVVNAL